MKRPKFIARLDAWSASPGQNYGKHDGFGVHLEKRCDTSDCSPDPQRKFIFVHPPSCDNLHCKAKVAECENLPAFLPFWDSTDSRNPTSPP